MTPNPSRVSRHGDARVVLHGLVTGLLAAPPPQKGNIR